jgi:hypothetical protein
MNFDRIKEKLEILADAAKYDVLALRVVEIVKIKVDLATVTFLEFAILIQKMADVFLCSKFCLPIIAFTIALIAFPENPTT